MNLQGCLDPTLRLDVKCSSWLNGKQTVDGLVLLDESQDWFGDDINQQWLTHMNPCITNEKKYETNSINV